MKVLGLGLPELIIIAAVVVAIVLVIVGMNRRKVPGASQQTTRYCPQCGTELPAAASFCKQCGHTLPPAINAQQGAAVSAQSSSPFSPVAVAGRVCAVVAIAAMLLPWIEIPGLQALNAYSSSYLGVSLSGNLSYDVYGPLVMFPNNVLSRALNDMLSTIPAVESSGTIYLVFLAAWGIALVFLAIGLIGTFIGGRNFLALRVAGIIAALVAIAWFAAVTYLDGECSRQVAQMLGANFRLFTVPPAVWVTFIAALATSVCGYMVKANGK